MSKQINVDMPNADWHNSPTEEDIQLALGSQKLLAVLRVKRSESGWSALVEVEAKKAKPAPKKAETPKPKVESKAKPKKSFLGAKSDSE